MSDRRLPLAIAGVLLAATACTASDTSLGKAGSAATVTTVSTSAPRSTSAPLPTSVSIPEDAHACDLVDEQAAADAGVDSAFEGYRNMWGTVCSAGGPVELFVLLTHGPNQGVGEFPPEMGAQVAMRKVGTFVARQEKVDQYCGLVVELVPGRALVVQLETKDKKRCDRVEALVTQALHQLASR